MLRILFYAKIYYPHCHINFDIQMYKILPWADPETKHKLTFLHACIFLLTYSPDRQSPSLRTEMQKSKKGECTSLISHSSPFRFCVGIVSFTFSAYVTPRVPYCAVRWPRATRAPACRSDLCVVVEKCKTILLPIAGGGVSCRLPGLERKCQRNGWRLNWKWDRKNKFILGSE